MNVSLTPELEKIVQDLVASGQFGNQSEVVRAALRLLHREEQAHQAKLEELRGEINIGLEQVLRGEGKSLTAAQMKANGRAALAARQAKSA